MAFNINQFNAEIASKGTAFQSNFDFYITLPNKLLNTGDNKQLEAHASMGGGGIGYSLSLRCEQIDFPGRGIQAIDGHRQMGFGTPINIPYAPLHLDISATFLCTRELEEKEIFERWQDLIVGEYRRMPSGDDIKNQFNPGYYDDVVKPCMIRLRQFDQLGAVMYEIELREVYPRTINPLQANWSSSDVHKLSVTFNYRHHVIKTEPIGIKESERVIKEMAPPPGQNFKFVPF